MSFSQTASLVETDNLLGIGGESGIGMGAGVPLLRGRFNALVSLVHVFDVPLEKKEVGRRLAVDLQCATIIPLDRSFNFFAVKQDNNHRRVRIDLLLVVKELGVGLHRWRRPLSHLYGRLLCRTRGFSTRVSSAVATMPSLGTAVGTFPGLRHFARLTLDLGERGSDEFTIAHLFLYLQKIRTDSKSIARRTFGGDGVTRTTVHSQAAAILGEGENFTRNGKPARSDAHATQAGVKKQRAKSGQRKQMPVQSKRKAQPSGLPFYCLRLELISQLSCE